MLPELAEAKPQPGVEVSGTFSEAAQSLVNVPIRDSPELDKLPGVERRDCREVSGGVTGWPLKKPPGFPHHESLGVVLAQQQKLVVEIDGAADTTQSCCEDHREGQGNKAHSFLHGKASPDVWTSVKDFLAPGIVSGDHQPPIRRVVVRRHLLVCMVSLLVIEP